MSSVSSVFSVARSLMVDSHCHLAGPEFEVDLDAVIARARDAGLTHALAILDASDADELARAPRVVERWPAVRFAVGVHPHTAKAFAERPDDVVTVVEERLDAIPGARAVGEIGLDYHYDFSPRDVQQAVFRAQLRLARRRGLPIVIHTREAEDDTFRILAEEMPAPVTGVVHCFTGDAAMARRVVAAGLHVSLAGIITFPRAGSIRDAAAAVPLDRLLVETDSPFLAPVPFRGTRNEPAHLVRVLEALARLRGLARSDMAAQVMRNFECLFRP